MGESVGREGYLYSDLFWWELLVGEGEALEFFL